MKSKLVQDGRERTFVLVLDAGDEIVATLLAFAEEYRLAGSHFTGIGAFERATLGFFKVDRKDYKRIPIREQVEVISLVGNIARDEAGKPKVHAHVVLGKSDGTAHGGHLLEGWVRPTLEVVLVESERHLRRKMNPQLGIPLIDTTE